MIGATGGACEWIGNTDKARELVVFERTRGAHFHHEDGQSSFASEKKHDRTSSSRRKKSVVSRFQNGREGTEGVDRKRHAGHYVASTTVIRQWEAENSAILADLAQDACSNS